MDEIIDIGSLWDWKVLVTGGRVGVNVKLIVTALRHLAVKWPKKTLLIHGAAKGTDTLCGMWAKEHGFYTMPMPVEPKLDGPNMDAPKNRNTRMARQNPDCLIAFPGHNGTLDMLNKAIDLGIPVFDVEEVSENLLRIHLILSRLQHAEQIAEISML